MSVPLERLYNFLHDVCNHDDVVIYRFFPDGSRKINDLKRSNVYREVTLDQHTAPVKKIKHKNFIFIHDQEPLNFDLYTSFDVVDQLLEDGKKDKFSFYQYLDDYLISAYKELIKKLMPDLNLKIVEGAILWKMPVILLHSEQRSNNLQKYENIDFIGVYWWSHALIARDWFRYAEHDPLLHFRRPQKDFLIYNRAWSGTREYRLKLAEFLIDYHLTDYCHMGFNQDDNGDYRKHQFLNPRLQIQRQDLEKYFFYNNSPSSSSADYKSDDYQHTELEIVLETLFDDDRLHLTEKSLRPIACGQPFILASTVGSLEYLRQYGFQTFGSIIDESYDTITDPLERLEAIVKEMYRIVNLDMIEKQKLYSDLRKIAQYNKKLFFSTEWQDSIMNEYKKNYTQAMLKLTQTKNIALNQL